LLRKTVSGIMLTLLFIGMLTLAFNIQPVKSTWTGTVYIRADGSIDPPDVPIITYDNITYTLTNNITSSADGIVVERDDIIIEGNGYTIQGTDSVGSKGVDLTGRVNVTVRNMNVKNFHTGIYLSNSSSCNINRNNITENGFSGIDLRSSFNNRIIESEVINNSFGMVLSSSSNNTVSNNLLNDNILNFGVYGSALSDFINEIDISNLINGKPIYYMINEEYLDITPNTFPQVGYLALVNCTGITVKNLNLHNNFQGLLCAFTRNSTIANNIITTCDAGIALHGSSNITIISNHINYTNIGIGLYQSSSYNKLLDNDIMFCFWSGISVDNSSHNVIANSNITKAYSWGIGLWHSNNNHIHHNNFTNPWSRIGIVLFRSSNNSITENTFVNHGLEVSNSYGNIVVGNIVNGKPLVYLEGISDYTVNDAGQVILIKCNRIKIENLNLSNINIGIQLLKTNNTEIIRNDITNNDFGIVLYRCSNNRIIQNNITNNGHGVVISGSSNNDIIGNSILNNFCGIELSFSSNNRIYHNNFIENHYQVFLLLRDAYANVWDDGYPSGGNYWSDYTGIDNNGDGIGDTPYVIGEYNVDHYPLMTPYTITPPVPSVINATVDMNPKALNLRSEGRWITAYIELPEGYNVSNIDVSTIMLNETVSVNLEAPIEIGDYDNDTVPDLMVCFNWTEVAEYILSKGIVFGNVSLEISGRLFNSIVFTGTDTILVSSLIGDVNVDGKVDGIDVSIVCKAFGSYPKHERWNPAADINGDNRIDGADTVMTCRNFGKHA